ncbi:MAG: hypothetical protein PHU23_06960 [Dehalococcoidales bacterium]|nr:hypothetical protein [Dehalococcoidales bacterium]
MPGLKYAQYIITEVIPKEEASWTPLFKPEEYTQMPFIDNRVIKGSFYVETAWMWPPLATNKTRGAAHKHDFDEVLAFFGSDPDNPQDLGAELEFQIEGENHLIKKSCLIFIPEGLLHGPPIFLNMHRPVFHFACGTGKDYF